MSDLAASGGYYIAMPAHAIVAQPSTLTGSIGIFGGKFVTGGVYEKLGANIESVEHRPARRDELAGASVQRRRGDEGRRSSCRRSTISSSRRSPSRATATPEKIDRARAGPRVDRPAGEGQRPRRRAGRPRSRRSRSRRSARRSPRTATSSWCVIRRTKSLYELLSEQLSGGGEQAAVSAWLSANLSSAELDALRALRGPLALFRRGEPLALMPFTFVR